MRQHADGNSYLEEVKVSRMAARGEGKAWPGWWQADSGNDWGGHRVQLCMQASRKDLYCWGCTCTVRGGVSRGVRRDWGNGSHTTDVSSLRMPLKEMQGTNGRGGGGAWVDAKGIMGEEDETQ